jgi:telomerase reverse transcriptase
MSFKRHGIYIAEYVQIGSEFYKQRVGIPQGSVLSTILCNFFYGDLEVSNKFKFTENISNVSTFEVE